MMGRETESKRGERVRGSPYTVLRRALFFFLMTLLSLQRRAM
jgi:hypothetical protein